MLEPCELYLLEFLLILELEDFVLELFRSHRNDITETNEWLRNNFWDDLALLDVLLVHIISRYPCIKVLLVDSEELFGQDIVALNFNFSCLFEATEALGLLNRWLTTLS